MLSRNETGHHDVLNRLGTTPQLELIRWARMGLDGPCRRKHTNHEVIGLVYYVMLGIEEV